MEHHPSPLLAIVGLTATGKTSLAWQIAELLPEFGFQHLDLISVDSRQVYKGLEIVSGADLPAEAEWESDERFPYPYARIGNVRIHGVGIVSPTQSWSAADFQAFAQRVIISSRATHGLPVCVGGTGLYYDVLTGSMPLSKAEPNDEIRAQAAAMSLEDLQAWVRRDATQVWEKMNASDRANPRRLVRALERAAQTRADENMVAHSILSASTNKPTEGLHPTLTIGLTAPMETIEENITQRVRERFAAGAAQEVETILAQLPPQDAFSSHTAQSFPALTATGVKELMAYLRGDVDRKVLEHHWLTRERQYAKRQLTWWKKRDDVRWFDVSVANWQVAALNAVREQLQKN